jgi:hypothetical protein
MLILFTGIHLLTEVYCWTIPAISVYLKFLPRFFGFCSCILRFHSNFFVWRRAAANRHYLVAIASLMALLTLSFQPLAAALLVVKDTYIQLPGASHLTPKYPT